MIERTNIPVKSLAVWIATVVGVIFVPAGIAIQLLEWAPFQPEEYFLLGWVAGLSSLWLVLKLNKVDGVVEHTVRADTWFETLQYPLQGDDEVNK